MEVGIKIFVKGLVQVVKIELFKKQKYDCNEKL